MTTMTRALLPLAAGAILLAGCDADAVGPGTPTVAVVEVSPTSRTMTVGDTLRLTAVARAGDGTTLDGRTVAWASLDGTYAEVAGAGATALVTARWPGSATIAATVEGKVGRTILTITAAAPVPATIELTGGDGWLEVGQEARIHAVVRSADGSVLDAAGLSWATDDEEVATVEPLGIPGTAKVIARGEGVTRIIARLEGLWAGLGVTIRPASEPASGLQLSPAPPTVERGKSVQLQAWVWALDGAWIPNPVVHWTSSDTTVARVSAGATGGRGTLTALAAGTITVYALSGGKTDSTRIAVVPPFDVGQVVVTSGDRSVWKTSLYAFRASVRGPTGATLPGAPITWSVEDSTVAGIDATGRATGLRAGSTRVVAESGGVRGTATLTVREWPLDGAFELMLEPTVDPAGGRRDVVRVGETTWTDSTGVVHPAWLWLTGGSLTLRHGGGRYTQRFEVDVMVSGFGGIMQGVERRVLEESGDVGLNLFDPYGFLLFPDGGGPALSVTAWEAGAWIIDQPIGSAESLSWFWTMG